MPPPSARLDGECARLLKRMARDIADFPESATIDERRALMGKLAAAYGPRAAPVARVADVSIAAAGGEVPLRIYWPDKRSRAPLPLLLHIHGGGWSIGDPDAYARICRAYCSAGGCIVVDVHYRRAPEHKFPVALEDCQAALEWAWRNAAALGADAARIVVTGDSAGGNLAAALCQTAQAPLALQILVYPVMSASAHADFASRRDFGGGEYFLREIDIKNAERDYLGDPADGEDPRVSPLLAPDAQLAKLPPTIIFTAEFDPLRDEGEAYADRLRACGVKANCERVKGAIHPFVLFAGRISRGRRAIAQIGRAISQARRS